MEGEGQHGIHGLNETRILLIINFLANNSPPMIEKVLYFLHEFCLFGRLLGFVTKLLLKKVVQLLKIQSRLSVGELCC